MSYYIPPSKDPYYIPPTKDYGPISGSTTPARSFSFGQLFEGIAGGLSAGFAVAGGIQDWMSSKVQAEHAMDVARANKKEYLRDQRIRRENYLAAFAAQKGARQGGISRFRGSPVDQAVTMAGEAMYQANKIKYQGQLEAFAAKQAGKQSLIGGIAQGVAGMAKTMAGLYA